MSVLRSFLWAFFRGEPNAIVPIGPYLLVCGMAAIGLSTFADGSGIITAFFVAGLGAAGAGLSEWRTERGLWMLAALLFLMYGFVYVCSCFGQLMDALRGAPANNTALVLDLSFGTLVLLATLRFLLKIAKENYVISASTQGNMILIDQLIRLCRRR